MLLPSHSNAESKALLRLEQPTKIVFAISGELEEKGFLMAPVSDVPDLAGQEMAVGARHRFSLKRAIELRKPVSKRWKRPYITTLRRKINVMRWSDRNQSWAIPNVVV
jgi:hypothetical protein